MLHDFTSIPNGVSSSHLVGGVESAIVPAGLDLESFSKPILLSDGLLVFLSVTLLSCSTRSHVLDEVPLIDGHNDLPFNLYKLVGNNLDKYDFEKNLTGDPVWGTKYCSTCHTDLPRLRAGKIGAQ
ncbi:hypothetical protein ILUMI_16975, partial [Ignelater luminosus]